MVTVSDRRARFVQQAGQAAFSTQVIARDKVCGLLSGRFTLHSLEKRQRAAHKGIPCD
jgi:hypothetical protein